MKIYLEGGGDIRKGELEGLDKKALLESTNHKVYVLDLTSNDSEKIAKYRDFLDSYFKNLGAEEVNFISAEKSQDNIQNSIKDSGLIYIPGGNTEILVENLEKKNIVSLLNSSKLIIVGNSAGALALCKEVILTKDEDVNETKILRGLGLIPFSVDVHYEKSHDKELFELSKGRDIYGIPEKGAILYDGKMEFIGDIWKFSHRKKEKID